eukprot:635938-Pleurochrysis_carterae.AAC.5
MEYDTTITVALVLGRYPNIGTFLRACTACCRLVAAFTRMDSGHLKIAEPASRAVTCTSALV